MSAALAQSAPLGSSTVSAPSSRGRLAGRILSGLAIAFLTFDVAIIGTLGLICLVLYAIPRTAPLGAILWTGYLGGAIATHLRLDNPLFTHILFPTYIAALLWGGLYLRDARVRGLVRPAR